jgi:hypothetical protein
MKVLLVAAVLGPLLLAGCDTASSPPRTGMQDTVLVAALAEAHLAGARAGRFDEDADSLRAVAYAALGVDSVQVAEALDAYAERPAALAKLYEKVTDRLRERHEVYLELEGVLPEADLGFDL